MITRDSLIIKRVRIGKNCIIGAHSVLSPGTIMEDNVVLGALSLTNLDQHLEANWIYMGRPAVKFNPVDDTVENLVDKTKN